MAIPTCPLRSVLTAKNPCFLFTRSGSLLEAEIGETKVRRIVVRSMKRVIISTFFAFTGATFATPPVGPHGEPARAIATYGPRPDYPLSARSRHLQGRGIFILYVRPDGTVASVEVAKSTGHAELDESGVAAFRKWRFRPGTVKKVNIPLAFTMQGVQYHRDLTNR
jgi:TonB family protein